jgi:hypothetical protein
MRVGANMHADKQLIVGAFYWVIPEVVGPAKFNASIERGVLTPVLAC